LFLSPLTFESLICSVEINSYWVRLYIMSSDSSTAWKVVPEERKRLAHEIYLNANSVMLPFRI
jgi:hypothetical protein